MEKRTDRVLSIDIIRGFALLGIFFVNVPAMQTFMSFDMRNGFEAIIRLFYDIFIQTNFYVIFSLLFGVSAYYFMRSQEKKGLAPRKLFWKRTAWLFVFGAVHYIFIWFGDILHSYALIGLLLPLFYKISPKKILLSAAVIFMISFSITQLPNLMPTNMDPSMEDIESVQAIDDSELQESIEQWEEEQANRTYLSKVKEKMQQLVYSLPYSVINYLEILALALLGLGLAKANFFEEFTRHKKIMKKIAVIAFLLSLPIMALMVKDFMSGVPMANHFYVWMSGKLLATVYVTLFLFACESVRMRQKLAPLAAYGKMAFTNYLSQSIITVFIVVPLIKDFTLLMQFVYCIVFLIIQVYVSTLIMKKYKYGPFEFVWRKLTFGSK
ncbi:MAG: DUF418 domain-containing protein [Solibacillus sp.]